MPRTPLAARKLPDYNRLEEQLNTISHIIGGGIGVIVTILAIWQGVRHHDTYAIIGGAVFGFTMILLYAMSSIYHGLPAHTMAKKVFQVLDHCTIFLLISGTYTPICLSAFLPYDAQLGWGVLAGVWAAAVLGITLNAIDLHKYRIFSMICYLGMGWCVVFSAGALGKIFVPQALWLLIGGGIAYTLGAVLYGIGSKKRYMHSVFHFFVLAGSICHALMIILYIL